jgi:hypothetical protein
MGRGLESYVLFRMEGMGEIVANVETNRARHGQGLHIEQLSKRLRKGGKQNAASAPHSISPALLQGGRWLVKCA